MRFTNPPLPPDEPEREPGVMHIGGARGQRLRAAAAWAAVVLAVAGVLVGLFVWFGTGVGWAAVLVGLMLAYMAAMARWAGGDPR